MHHLLFPWDGILFAMPVKKRLVKKRLRCQEGTAVFLDAFAAGGIAALAKQGYSQREIADSGSVFKEDGSGVCFSTVGKVLRRHRSDPTWRGDRQEGSGRPRSTTPQQDEAIAKYVVARRGKEVITSKKVKHRLRLGSRSLVQRRLREKGLSWLRRRSKTLVPAESLVARLACAARVMKCTSAYLRRWVYSDGCSFYLDRSSAEVQNAERLSLGKFVYRMADGSDALYKDCVGPSSYKKTQGSVVRVWGLLVNGTLHISVLEKGTVMNQ